MSENQPKAQTLTELRDSLPADFEVSRTMLGHLIGDEATGSVGSKQFAGTVIAAIMGLEQGILDLRRDLDAKS